MGTDKKPPIKQARRGRTIPLVILAVVSIGFLILTNVLSTLPAFSFIAAQRHPLVSAELILFGVVLVEMVGHIIVSGFKQRGSLGVGIHIRAIIRGAAYIGLAIAVISILAESPALAIGIGTVSGVIIGFASQNLIGNVFAGMLLAILRPVRGGDHITVAGGAGSATGRVQEIDLIYTILDNGESWHFVPNMLMFSNTIRRQKVSSGDGATEMRL